MDTLPNVSQHSNAQDDSTSITIINSCLTKFHLSLIDSSVLFCHRCCSILLRENVRDHLRKRHQEFSSAKEQNAVMKCSENQSTSCYIQLAHGSSVDRHDKFRPIEYLPVILGFRCARCNFADKMINELARRHQKFQSGHCSDGSFEESRIQVVRIGGKYVGFGVKEDLDSDANGSLHLPEVEYQKAHKIISNLDHNDSVKSELQQNRGSFRTNPKGSDFVNYGVEVSQQAKQFGLDYEFAPWEARCA